MEISCNHVEEDVHMCYKFYLRTLYIDASVNLEITSKLTKICNKIRQKYLLRVFS